MLRIEELRKTAIDDIPYLDPYNYEAAQVAIIDALGSFIKGDPNTAEFLSSVRDGSRRGLFSWNTKAANHARSVLSSSDVSNSAIPTQQDSLEQFYIRLA